MEFDNFTLDINSSVMTSYVKQEGAKKGTIRSNRGGVSNHALIAY